MAHQAHRKGLRDPAAGSGDPRRPMGAAHCAAVSALNRRQRGADTSIRQCESWRGMGARRAPCLEGIPSIGSGDRVLGAKPDSGGSLGELPLVVEGGRDGYPQAGRNPRCRRGKHSSSNSRTIPRPPAGHLPAALSSLGSGHRERFNSGKELLATLLRLLAEAEQGGKGT